MVRIYNNTKLEFNTLLWDFNKKNVTKFNIFGSDFIPRFKKKYRKTEIKNKKTLKEFILSYCFNYMGRCEYEFLVRDYFTEEPVKIDVYYQVLMNIDLIVDYVNNKLKLGFK